MAPGTLPPPYTAQPQTDWSPYNNRAEFELAEFLFQRSQMPMAHVDVLMNLWAASLLHAHEPGSLDDPPSPPFANHQELHKIIDATEVGDVTWDSFHIEYNGLRPEKAPEWMDKEYDIWYRNPKAIIKNMLANPDFDGDFDYVPYREHDQHEKRRYSDFMSGNWVWEQAVGFSVTNSTRQLIITYRT